MSTINDGILDYKETVKYIRFTTFGLKKPYTMKYSPLFSPFKIQINKLFPKWIVFRDIYGISPHQWDLCQSSKW
jgi:hypothetical protein